jgi:hypothetical protein
MERYGAIVVSWACTIPGRETKLPSILHKAFTYGETLRKQGRIVEVRSFVTKAGPHRDTLQIMGKLGDLSTILVEQGFESLILESRAVVQDINIALWEGSAPSSEGMSIQCRPCGDAWDDLA